MLTCDPDGAPKNLVYYGVVAVVEPSQRDGFHRFRPGEDGEIDGKSEKKIRLRIDKLLVMDFYCIKDAVSISVDRVTVCRH